ncbi:MAG TPA: hypothetical protein VK522_09055 [Pseudolabrys sp.]|nr:hypothetical protein [Pseudolabrys sp.]
MPLFEVSKISEMGASPEIASFANEGIDKLRARLVNEIAVSVLPNRIVKSMVQVFFQGHIRRSLMLIEGGYEAYQSGRGLVVYICARAIYETVACVLDFCDKLTDHLVAGDFIKTCHFLYARTHAARMEGLTGDVDGFGNTAINILTQIDRLSKHLPNLREDYEFLSERAHPNALGALHFFSEDESTNEDEGLYKFSNGTEQKPSLSILISAGRMLGLMEHGMSVMEAKLAEHHKLRNRR